MQLIGVFAGICILILCLGLFGLASFTTAQRTKEDINVLVFLFAATLAMLVAFLTVALQSYKSARANPGEALGYEQ